MAIEIALLNNSNPNQNSTYFPFNNEPDVPGTTSIPGGYWRNASKAPGGTLPQCASRSFRSPPRRWQKNGCAVSNWQSCKVVIGKVVKSEAHPMPPENLKYIWGPTKLSCLKQLPPFKLDHAHHRQLQAEDIEHLSSSSYVHQHHRN